MKDCLYHNTETETAFKIILTEFVKKQTYESLEHLQYKLSDYTNQFNNHRIYSSLGYLTSKEYWSASLKKVV